MYLSVICLPAIVAKAGRGDGSDCLIFSLDVACIYLNEEQGVVQTVWFFPWIGFTFICRFIIYLQIYIYFRFTFICRISFICIRI